jgi:hypothetical protein
MLLLPDIARPQRFIHRLILVYALISLFILSSAQTTVMLTPSKDNTIYSESTNSNALGNLYAGRAGAAASGATRRALLRFDLTSIPAGATIISASLILIKNKGGASTTNPSDLHKLSADWGEGTSFDDPGASPGDGGGDGATATTGDATWVHRFFNTSNWMVTGGDFLSSPSGSTVVNSTNGQYTWSGAGLVADVQSWVDNPAVNFGWILRGDESITSSAARFNSRESSTGKPTLTVQYTTCPANLNLTGTIASGTYHAEVISASGTVQNSSLVFLKALDHIDLLPDFTVESGGQLEISLDGCN